MKRKKNTRASTGENISPVWVRLTPEQRDAVEAFARNYGDCGISTAIRIALSASPLLADYLTAAKTAAKK